MNLTLGKRIATLRRQKGLRQEDLAEQLNVSAQAISKWENELSCPDISLLPQLASILGVTVDELLTGQTADAAPQVKILPEKERKGVEELMLRIVCEDDDETVRICIPMVLVQIALDTGIELHQISVENDAIKKIDLRQILSMVQKGVIGNLMEIESSDGGTVRIFVE